MNKFSCLVINKNLGIQRCWMNNQQIYTLLTSNSDLAVYRTSNDQEAIIEGDHVYWKDVPLGDEYKA